jgi:5-methyltetrahydropteroyltriglutamate--homocysteine methyltransferase
VHICKGNDANRFMAKGGYAKIAERVFPKLHAQRLLLEFDDERSGDFECLKFVPDDKIVVLGLISTKKSEMETLEGLQERIQEASRIIPLDRLAVSTQCGFASVAKGNFLSFETQLEKLKLVAEVAGLVWEK